MGYPPPPALESHGQEQEKRAEPGREGNCAKTPVVPNVAGPVEHHAQIRVHLR